MADNALYVYGIIRSGAAIATESCRGVGDGGVRVAEEGALGAIVTELSTAAYEAQRGDLVAHSDVLQAVVESADVLPMGFGTVFTSATELSQTFLQPNREALVRMLDETEAMVEVQVRGEYDPDAVAREIASSDRPLQKLQARARSRGDVESKIELGRRFATVLDQIRYSDGRAIVDALAATAREVSVGDAPGEYALLRASFLVARDHLASFDAAAEKAAAALGGRGTLRCVGPLPPYSFVDASALAVG